METSLETARQIWTNRLASIESRVAALMGQMTLAEKVAQLGSVWEVQNEAGPDVAPMSGELNSGGPSFEELTDDGLGHLTRIFGSTPISVADGVALLQGRQDSVRERNRLGIPAIAHEECLTGFTTLGATVYPTALAWGATFDEALIEGMAGAIGADMAAVGVHQGLSPVLDIVRDARWGRVEETMGEDPYLVSVLGSAYVRGLQGQGVIATLKHFAGYALPQRPAIMRPFRWGAASWPTWCCRPLRWLCAMLA